jgi:L-fuconate dehydratase
LTITRLTLRDARFPLTEGAGTDSLHTNPVYSYATALLHTDSGVTGTGLAFTLGGGNELVCQAIALLAEPLIGLEIESLMAQLGALQQRLGNHPQLRWLGPHKGVVQLALAALNNACWDLWAKAHGVPLWKLLLELSPEALLATLDLSYLDDALTAYEALTLLRQPRTQTSFLTEGYPGYDTSAGWLGYDDTKLTENIQKSLGAGFTALKLKVGSEDFTRDLRRATLVREAIGSAASLMLDANQKWSLSEAEQACQKLAPLNPLWIEEPTHPDDLLAHQRLNREIIPGKIASGEHFPNRIVFKNYLQAGALAFVQADAVRLAGVSEFLAVSLMARKFNKPIVPHVGDMGQLHQHLVVFNAIALGMEPLFLEHIPHLKPHFLHPAQVENGVYQIPQEPGSSCDLR